MNKFFQGFSYFCAGFQLMVLPGVKRYVVLPIMINIGLFILLFSGARHVIKIFDIWFVEHLPTWLHWLSGVLWVVFIIAFMLLFAYTFVTFANLIAAPFNSLLSEKLALQLTGQVIPSQSLLNNIKDIPRIIGRQLAVIAYYLPRALLILFLFFIPLVHVLATPLWLLFNAWFIALTYLDYPSDNQRISLFTLKNWMKDNRLQTLGFGLGALLAAMVPILNLFAMPAAVAGATKLWLDRHP